MTSPKLYSLLRRAWQQRFPLVLTLLMVCLLSPLFSAQAPSSTSRKVKDLRTGKGVENVIADGTIYRFEATVPNVNLWQVPLPLEGVWMESNDKQTLTWISSLSGGSGDSTDCGGVGGGGSGNCPSDNPTCGGVEYDPVTEGCCDGQIYTLATEGCCEGVVYTLATEVCCVGKVRTGQSCPRCDNPHGLNRTVYECHHYSTNINGDACSTTRVIENQLISATCDFHENADGPSECNVKVGVGAELVQIFHKDVSCPGGTVNWVDWQTIYIGCGTNCGPSEESPYEIACETDPTSGTFDGFATRGVRKVIGCP